jgi:DNA primase
MARSLSRNIDKIEKGPDNSFLKRINVQDLLEHYDIPNVKIIKPDVYQFSCPFSGHSHGDEHPSAVFNDGVHQFPTSWRCYGCGRSGNAISFVAEYDQVSRTKARQWLKEHYAPGFSKPKGGIQKEFEHQMKRKPTGTRAVETVDWAEYERFAVDWGYYAEEHRDEPDVAYMLDRGFTPKQLSEWNIGYDHVSNRITIPICDPQGNLVGIKARAWNRNHKPRYIALGDRPDMPSRYGFKPYEKSLVVFGLDYFGEQPTYVLDEGEINVLSFRAIGIPACSTGSATMSEEQMRIIKQYCDEVIIFFDDNKAGNRAVYGYDDDRGEHRPGIVERLRPHLKVKVADKHKLDANDHLKLGKIKELQTLVESALPEYLALAPDSVV